jgi:DNA repair protein RadC
LFKARSRVSAGGTGSVVLVAGSRPLDHAKARWRILNFGADPLTDQEVLQLVLTEVLPAQDLEAVARLLLQNFGSFASTISAPVSDLRALGIRDAGIAVLKAVHVAAQRLARAEVVSRPVLTNWERLMEYLIIVLSRERVEHCRVLFLDNRNRLLADEALARGTVDHTPVYPREVMKRALELHSTALILVHNHPSGDPTPKPDDIAMTQEVKAAAQSLSIVLHDHVIVGNGCWISLRREGLL